MPRAASAAYVLLRWSAADICGPDKPPEKRKPGGSTTPVTTFRTLAEMPASPAAISFLVMLPRGQSEPVLAVRRDSCRISAARILCGSPGLRSRYAERVQVEIRDRQGHQPQFRDAHLTLPTAGAL